MSVKEDDKEAVSRVSHTRAASGPKLRSAFSHRVAERPLGQAASGEDLAAPAMRRSRSRTGNTPPLEMDGNRSQQSVRLGSPRPSASAGLSGGSRTLIAFSSSASSQGGGSSSAYRRVSSHAGSQRLDPAGSASAMHRSVVGHGRIASGTEHAQLRMQSSRSDSLIHEKALSSESRSSLQRQSGNALGGLTSIHITPISSGIESMFDSRTSRDLRIRGKTRSGEGAAHLLSHQLEESGSSISSRRMRRLSGSQIRAASASRSPASREEHGALRELVEREIHEAKHRRLGSPLTRASKAGSSHSSSEVRREAQRHTSSSLATDAKSSKSGVVQEARSSSSGHAQRSRTASSSEKMIRTLGTRSSQGALTSASKTEYESAERLKSLTDKRKTSESKLAAVSLTESSTRKDMAGVPGLFPADATLSQSGTSPIRQGFEMSTALNAERMTGATATDTKHSDVSAFTSREKMHAVGSTAERKTVVSSSAAETAKLDATGTTTKGSAIENQKQVSATGATLSQDTTLVGVKSATQSTSAAGRQSSLQTLVAEGKNVTSGGTSFQKIGSSEGAASKSLTQESVQRSQFFSDRSSDAQAVPGAQSNICTSGEQVAHRSTVLGTAEKDTLAVSTDKPSLLTSGLLEKKSSKSVVRESMHRSSLPLSDRDAFSTLSDVKGKGMSTSVDQGAVQQSLLQSSTTPALTNLSERTSLFTTSSPKGTSSKTIIKESVFRTNIFSDKTPDTATMTDVQTKTLTTTAEKSTFKQELTGKQATHTLFDTDIKGTPVNTSLTSQVQETVHQASFTPQNAPDVSKIPDTLGKTTYSSQQTTLQQAGGLETARATLVDAHDKPSLLSPTLLEKRTSSKSLIQKSEHQTSFPSDKPHTVSTFSESIFTTPTAKGTSSKSIIKESVYQRNISSDKMPDIGTLSGEQGKAVYSAAEHGTSQQTHINVPLSSNATSEDANIKTTTSVKQETTEHKFVDSGTTFTLADSAEKSGLLKSTIPERTSSRSLIQDSVHRALSSPLKAPDVFTASDVKSSTLTTFKNQSAVQQTAPDKGTSQTRLDVREKNTVMPSSSLKKRTSSRSLLHRTSFQLDRQPDLRVTGSRQELLTRSEKLGIPQQRVLETTTVSTTVDSSGKSALSAGFAPEKATSSSISKETIRQTVSSSTKAAGSKENLSASADENITQRVIVTKDSPTSADNYSLSTGAQLTMTQKCSTRWKNNAPIQQSFFEKVEGSNYHKSFDSALQRSQHPSAGVKEDFQSFQITSTTEPIQAAIQSPLKLESLVTKPPLDLTAEHASERKEKQVESITALTPMPDFPLIGSTPKASSEEVRSTETPRKITELSDEFQWPRREVSSHLGAAAALFEAPSEVTHFDQRPINTGLSQSTERIEQVTLLEKQAGASMGFQKKRIFGPQTKEEFERAQVVEPLIKPQTAHLLYDAEQEHKVDGQAGYQTYTDSSLIQYTPEDSILAELVREVERKIEASARYHVEPLPDDLITVRSSKGIESLGRLKYETYEEELLMRRSEDDLIQESQKPVAEDQEAYSGVVEEFYTAASHKKIEEQEPVTLIQTSEQATVDSTEVTKVKPEELVSEVTKKTKDESLATMRELEQLPKFEEREIEAKKVAPEKTSDTLREERKRLFEQQDKVPSLSEAQKVERKTSIQEKKTIERTQRVGLTAAQGATEEREAKVYIKKHQTHDTSESAVRRFIAAAIEEAARREEAGKSVKRFREYPCSAEDTSKTAQVESSESSAMESSAEQERRIGELKVEKGNSLPQLVRCKSIAGLIEQIIQQHVSGTDVRKHAVALEGATHNTQMAPPPGFHSNIVRQEIPVYYQTAATSRRLGDQYVNDYRCSLQGVQRKSDDGNIDRTQLESASQGEQRISFSSSHGARCVIRKLEPGALTYLVEVAPTDKAQENQTDMVMAEEQVLVSEIFDHITAPSLRVCSSGAKLNEPITVSPAASLTTIRNAYAEAVARRILGGQSASGTEGVLGAAQKAQFFDEKQWTKDGKTASSTSVHSSPSVEDYMMQTMLASGILRAKTEPWRKNSSKFESEVRTRASSMDKLSKTVASSEGIVAPPPTPPCNAEFTAEEGAGYQIGTAQDTTEQSPKDLPSDAMFASTRAESAAASDFSESTKPTVAAEAAGSDEKISSAAVSRWATTQESEMVTTAETEVKSEAQNAVSKQQSEGYLKGIVRTGSNTCTVCNNQIPAEKSLQSLICFGCHDVPKYFANVPSSVSESVKLRIATDDDVRQLLSLPFKDADSACVVPAAVVTRHILCPRGFFVAIDTSKDTICGTASVIIFDEEVAFCGFCHIFEDYPFEEVGAMLWNQMLHLTNGKNLFTLLPESASQDLIKIYQFPSNPATGIVFGTARMSRAAFARTILVLDYKDKYFDALASYDKHVFGFNRKRYLASSVHEVGLDIRVATRNERNICGYGGVQRDEVGRRILRWLFADDAETAESLLSSLLASCSDEDEVDLIGAFFLRSTATRPILDKIINSRELQPWRLLYTKREPMHSYGRIVCLTTV